MTIQQLSLKDTICYTCHHGQKVDNVCLTVLIYVHIITFLAEAHPEFQNNTFVSNNMAVMHIYFDKLHFIMHQRGELYTATDFLANIGGLMGLCLGISAMSVLEFIYFFTARLFFNITTPRSEDY